MWQNVTVCATISDEMVLSIYVRRHFTERILTNKTPSGISPIRQPDRERFFMLRKSAEESGGKTHAVHNAR